MDGFHPGAADDACQPLNDSCQRQKDMRRGLGDTLGDERDHKDIYRGRMANNEGRREEDEQTKSEGLLLCRSQIFPSTLLD